MLIALLLCTHFRRFLTQPSAKSVKSNPLANDSPNNKKLAG